MKKLLSNGGALLLIAAFLDPVICSGLGKPVPWMRDVPMAAAGIACLYNLVKFRKSL
jgi:hypothetical protein